jgi:hypothetical protein
VPARDVGAVRVNTLGAFTLDLKHAGLIVSAGAAIALRFFSDFSFASIQHQALLAGLDISHLSLATLGALVVNSLGYQLQRDWFNLSPQAPPEVLGSIIVLLGAYVLLRRVRRPESAAAIVLLGAPFLPLVVTVGACGWILLRAAYAG